MSRRITPDANTGIVPRIAELPDDLATLPRYASRQSGAAIVTLYYFPVSERSLETWGLLWLMVNGRSVTETAGLLAEAQRRLDAATVLTSTRRPMPELPPDRSRYPGTSILRSAAHKRRAPTLPPAA